MNEQDIYHEIGRRIRRFRKAAGQTQQQLDYPNGVSRARSRISKPVGKTSYFIMYIYRRDA